MLGPTIFKKFSTLPVAFNMRIAVIIIGNINNNIIKLQGKNWLQQRWKKTWGIMVSANGRNTEQVEAAVNKASWVLRRIRKTFRS